MPEMFLLGFDISKDDKPCVCVNRSNLKGQCEVTFIYGEKAEKLYEILKGGNENE